MEVVDGLVSGQLELSAEGRAMKFFEVIPFVLRLTPGAVAEAVQTLSEKSNKEGIE